MLKQITTLFFVTDHWAAAHPFFIVLRKTKTILHTTKIIDQGIFIPYMVRCNLFNHF